jgi:N-acetylmuramate 1-kinase
MNTFRFQDLQQWLKSELNADFKISPMIGDASFRRYFRVFHNDKTFVAVDSPPDREDSSQFIAIDRLLAARGVHVPQIVSFNVSQGFMLLSDFGDRLYQQELNNKNVDLLYGMALKELLKMQVGSVTTDIPLPNFDGASMMQELLNFRTWFLEHHLRLQISSTIDQLLTEIFEKLVHSAAFQPQSFIHRDYHSRNLMVLEGGVGVLDFQDAAYGPITYDAVSLLRDCYIDWPHKKVVKWALSYCESLRVNGLLKVADEVFLKWFDWMGIQRHLKAIFIFARKYHRDQAADYLQYIPRSLSYVVSVSQCYPELIDFYSWMKDQVLPCYALAKKGYYEAA